MLEILQKTYADRRGDKSEKLVLLIDDGQIFTFAGSDPNGFSVSLAEIIRTLARKEVSICQVTDIFHNHNNPRDGFSPTDRALYETLSKAGIKTGFHIFYPETRRIKTHNPMESARLILCSGSYQSNQSSETTPP